MQHTPDSAEWRLVLRPVELRDQGWYSCQVGAGAGTHSLTQCRHQVSTTPHLEHRMYLGVIQPKTVIMGPQERYIEKGSTINLTCIIQVDI